MVSTCCPVRRTVIEYSVPDHVGFGSRYPSPMDVTLFRPFVHSVPSPWKVKMALSNSYSQPTNNLVDNTLEKNYFILIGYECKVVICVQITRLIQRYLKMANDHLQ